MADPTDFQIFHSLWTGVITVAGGIVAFFTKRLVDQVDQKADREEVDTLRDDIRDWRQEQERQHRSNTERLDQIILELGRR
jgi:hypothetical protein